MFVCGSVGGWVGCMALPVRKCVCVCVCVCESVCGGVCVGRCGCLHAGMCVFTCMFVSVYFLQQVCVCFFYCCSCLICRPGVSEDVLLL